MQDGIKLVKEPIPQLRPHDLLVRVRTAGLNRADILQRQGFYGEQSDFGDSINWKGRLQSEAAAWTAGVRDGTRSARQTANRSRRFAPK